MKCDKCGKENTPSEYCVWSDKLKKCIRYISDIKQFNGGEKMNDYEKIQAEVEINEKVNKLRTFEVSCLRDVTYTDVYIIEAENEEEAKIKAIEGDYLEYDEQDAVSGGAYDIEVEDITESKEAFKKMPIVNIKEG